jgi:glucuronoarabinoxylan endo-1,4-beta-xylanase
MSTKGMFVPLFVVITVLLGTSYGATGQIAVNTRYQTIEGFGAAGAWYEGWLTAHPNRETLYNLLFDDLGLDIYRVRNTYDYDSAYMSRTQTIVTEALQRNPNLKILISSWSPPTYLKSTGELDSGTLIGGPSNYDYEGFAQWWADSIIAWSSYGVDADYISIQNEPDYDGNDRCLFDPTQNSSHAGYNQAFEAVYNEMYSRFGSSMPKMIGPECIGLGYNAVDNYLNAIINHSHVYGYAHHLYHGGGNGQNPDGYIPAMQDVSASWGSKPLFQTEYQDATGAWPDALNLAHLLHNSLTVEGVSMYLYWGLVWDDPYGLVSLPNYGGSSYIINSDYYGMKHYSAFIFPGWQRVYATENSSSLLMSAYISPSNLQVTVVIINTGGSDVSLDLSFNGFSISTGTVYRSTSSQNCANVGSYTGGSLTLSAESITTLLLTGTGDVTAPSAPTGLNATEGNLQVDLNWNNNSESDLNGYNVYRSTTYGGPYSQINVSLATSSDYVDNTVTAGTTYYYVVTAVDMSMNESGYSNQSSATPYDGTPPAAPTALLATTGNGTVSLDWLDNSEDDLDGYNVYRSTTSGSGYSKVNGSLVGSSDYTDNTVTNETTYYYVVTAVDIYTNESGYSTEVSATPTANPSSIYTFEGITASDTEYNAFACDVDTFPFESSSDNVNAKTEATDLEYINISANDTAEWATADAGFLDEIFLRVEMKINEAPENISRIDLTFNGNTGGSADVVHQIYVMKAGTDWTLNSSWVQVGSDMSITPGADTTMTRSITSDFSTYINDANGKIIWAVYETTSSEVMNINYLEMAVTAAGNTEAPAAPTGLMATPDNNQVSLDWADNGEADLAGYYVHRSTTPGNNYTQLNGSPLSNSDYIDNTASNYETYYYVVTAADTNDNESDYSDEVSATPDLYQNCTEVQAGDDGLVSDLTGDCYVNLEDLKIVTVHWMDANCVEPDNCDGADFEPVDGDVDLEDFSDFAVDWLLCNDPVDLSCIKNWWP